MHGRCPLTGGSIFAAGTLRLACSQRWCVSTRIGRSTISVYDPNRNETLKAYRSKFGKVKQDEMHEYVTDESDDEGDDEGDDESVEGDE